MKVSPLVVRAWENSLARAEWLRDGLVKATALNPIERQKQIAIRDEEIELLKQKIKNAKENSNE